MLRLLYVVSLVVAAFASASADLCACGDKFLRIGRSARFRGYAAVHPSSILIYKPANSTPAGIKEFEALLKRAGHKPLSSKNGSPSLAGLYRREVRRRHRRLTPTPGRSRRNFSPFRLNPGSCRS